MPSPASERFFGGFYRNPDPADAAAAALEFLTSPPPEPNRSGVWVMLVRALQVQPGLRAELDALRSARPELAPPIDEMLAASSRPDFSALAELDPKSPADLDLLWCEFLLTGSKRPVERIAAQLDREDRMLAALTGWLGEAAWMPWTKAARSRTIASLQGHGIRLDRDRERLGNELDLDLHVWSLMSGGFQVRSEMPFALPDDTILHMAIKGAACWSMQSNAQQHEIVRDVYEAIPRRSRFPRFVREGTV